jgi:Mor family transcriptional regulator
MENNSRIRFNPVTKEIEIEGSESFVKTYFDKLQEVISGPAEKIVAAKKESKAIKAAPTKKTGKKLKTAKAGPVKKVSKNAKKKPMEKRVTHIDMIVELIQGSSEGISTAELKKKTGLSELQIWGIVNRVAKEGKIRKMKRGLYGAV